MSPRDEPPFSRITIAGLGLIGGSIALAARERWPQVRILGIDKSAVIAHALGSGAIDRGAGDAADARESDLVILAAPVRQNVVLLADMAQRLTSSTVITDVGGTKRDIVAAARTMPLAAAFVGGHPIGGAERGGFGFARPDLFRGRPWIFTPDGTTPAHALDRLAAFVSGLGARPATLAPDRHDRLMAFVSHLPQLAASALMDVIGTAVGGEGLALAGRGLVDTTRLASSPPGSWVDICAVNADELGGAIDALIARLTDLRKDLHGGDTIHRTFDEAARWRAELMKGRE